MPTELHDQLRALGSLLHEFAPPIGPDEYTAPTAAELDEWLGTDPAPLVQVGGHRPGRGTGRAVLATAALVAAALVMVVVLTQRRAEAPVADPPPGATAPSAALPDAPAWYTTIRPFVPERFTYISLIGGNDSAFSYTAIDPVGPSLDIKIDRIEMPSSDGDPTPTLIDDVGTWTEMPDGFAVTVQSGRIVQVTCDIGEGVPDLTPPTTNPCESDSASSFDKIAIRSIASAIASGFPIDALDSSFTTSARAFTDATSVRALADSALTGQAVSTEGGHGDAERFLVYSRAPAIVGWDTSIGIVHGVYPVPNDTTPATLAAHGGVSTGWVVSNEGTAIRLTSTSTDPAELTRLDTLLAQLAALPVEQRDDTTAPTTTTMMVTTPAADVQAVAAQYAQQLPDGVVVESQSTDPASGQTTVWAADPGQTYQAVLTMSHGLQVVPENHSRNPIEVVAQTDLSIHVRLASNSGWTFELAITRTSEGPSLPTPEALQTMFEQFDP